MSEFALKRFIAVPFRIRDNRDNDRGGKTCEGGVSASWGDGVAIQWEGYLKGEVYDGKGNYAEVRATQKEDGTGIVDICGGYESKNK